MKKKNEGKHKVLKIIGIILLIYIIVIFIKTKIFENISWLKEDYYKDFITSSKLEKKYNGIGNYKISEVVYKSDNKKIKNIRVYYPKELETSNKKYPLIMEVNASNTKAKNLAYAFKRLASWGFIVVGTDDSQTGNGKTTMETIKFILNIGKDSVLYNKVDKDNMGIVGYSQGGAGALRVVSVLGGDKYFKTIFTGSASYPKLSKNLGWEYYYDNIKIPYFMTASTGNSDDRGIKINSDEFAGVAPLESLELIYNNLPENILKVRARVSNSEHEDMLIKTDGYMTAWMLYHLKNDKESGKVFIGDDAEILTNKNWQDIKKNQ